MSSQARHAAGDGDDVVGVRQRRMSRMSMPAGTVVETNGRKCQLIDVSALGAQLESEGAIRPSQTLDLAWRRNGRLVEAKGVVVWSQARLAGPSLLYRAGIEFREPVSLRDTGYLEEDFGLPS